MIQPQSVALDAPGNDKPGVAGNARIAELGLHRLGWQPVEDNEAHARQKEGSHRG